MKFYSERIGEVCTNCEEILRDLCMDALELVAKPTSYRDIKEAERPNLQKATEALVDLVNACGESPVNRVTTLHMLAKADFRVFPLSLLTVSAEREFELLYQTMLEVEGRMEA